MTRLFFSSATLKATHWPYRMIAMNSMIERMKLIANEPTNSSPVWGPFVGALGSAGSMVTAAGAKIAAWSVGVIPALTSRSWMAIELAACWISTLLRAMATSFE